MYGILKPLIYFLHNIVKLFMNSNILSNLYRTTGVLEIIFRLFSFIKVRGSSLEKSKSLFEISEKYECLSSINTNIIILVYQTIFHI